jgi:ribosome maturation factor RimP|uniref:Ribosome maturation factor RimP n=1 Tax=candidate division WOR-3 bacterium TaxID=2052148 RepID=A0A7V3VUF4_UNCW3
MHKVDLQKIETIVKGIIEPMDFRIYDIQFNEVSRTLKIFIDREQGGITIRDCERVSNAISNVLDNSDIIDFQYTLEVSSPGIERHLSRIEHFQWARGKMAEITLKDRKIRGYIREAGENSVKVAQGSGEVIIKYSEIVRAKLSGEFDYGK